MEKKANPTIVQALGGRFVLLMACTIAVYARPVAPAAHRQETERRLGSAVAGYAGALLLETRRSRCGASCGGSRSPTTYRFLAVPTSCTLRRQSPAFIR